MVAVSIMCWLDIIPSVGTEQPIINATVFDLFPLFLTIMHSHAGGTSHRTSIECQRVVGCMFAILEQPFSLQ
jgi:hypothetical protein